MKKETAISKCCSAEMVYPEMDLAGKMGSLWMAYACYICKGCEKACIPVDKSQIIEPN